MDKLFNEYVAIILSVTFVLAFGEVCVLGRVSCFAQSQFIKDLNDFEHFFRLLRLFLKRYAPGMDSRLGQILSGLSAF